MKTPRHTTTTPRKFHIMIAAVQLLATALLSATPSDSAGSDDPATTTDGAATTVSEAPNFAVVWQWKTRDKSAINPYVSDQFSQLSALVESGVVESVYFGATHGDERFDRRSNVTFVISAPSDREASAILDEMAFVKAGISTYSLFPIGTKWLGRDPEAIHKRGLNRSYVTIWTTLVDKVPDEAVQEQVASVMELWREGVVENAYFDIEGVSRRNVVTDFLMFVNAESEKEAREIVHGLPFYQQEIARYNLYPVGVFWMSKEPN